VSKPEAAGHEALSLFSLVEPEMRLVGRQIEAVVRDENRLVADVAEALLAAPGKRLRPALVLLAGQAAGAAGAILLPTATAVELIHMATLTHDDILDRADWRRGEPSVRAVAGDQVAVLAGDFLFARAVQLLASTGRPAVVAEAAEVVHAMCLGEIRQHQDHGRRPTEAEYLKRIEAKTATFLAICCRLGALAADAGPQVSDPLYRFGWNVGMAFQLVDDLLDLVADPDKLGKAVAADYVQGVVTLPVVYALEQSRDARELAGLLETGRPADLPRVRLILAESGALDYVRAKIDQYRSEAERALAELAPSPAARALGVLAAFVVTRDF
jgi:heptaprenyl diphosphate synthase